MGDQAAWGRSTVDAFRDARFKLLLSGTPFRTDDIADPVGHLRRRRRLGARLRLRLHGRAARPRLPPRDVPPQRRRHGVDERRPPPARRLLRRPAGRGGGAPPAHRARPRRRLDRPRAARRRPAAGARARRRPPGRGRARDRRRQGARRGAGRAARAAGRRAAGRRHLRRAGRLRADRALRRRSRDLARLGADGLRGRRRPAPARRRLRDERAHGALLPPGRRPLHPPHAGAARADVRTSTCRRTRRSSGSRRRSRRNAATRSTLEPTGEPLDEPAERVRSEPGDAFRALWSLARTARPRCCRRRSRGRRCRSSPPTRRRRRRSPRSRRRRRPSAGGPSRPAEETAHERRERLRDERRALVSALSRLTGDPHKVIHARVNRETGATSVTAASAAQLEKGNALLEREAARRR